MDKKMKERLFEGGHPAEKGSVHYGGKEFDLFTRTCWWRLGLWSDFGTENKNKLGQAR